MANIVCTSVSSGPNTVNSRDHVLCMLMASFDDDAGKEVAWSIQCSSFVLCTQTPSLFLNENQSLACSSQQTDEMELSTLIRKQIGTLISNDYCPSIRCELKTALQQRDRRGYLILLSGKSGCGKTSMIKSCTSETTNLLIILNGYIHSTSLLAYQELTRQLLVDKLHLTDNLPSALYPFFLNKQQKRRKHNKKHYPSLHLNFKQNTIQDYQKVLEYLLHVCQTNGKQVVILFDQVEGLFNTSETEKQDFLYGILDIQAHDEENKNQNGPATTLTLILTAENTMMWERLEKRNKSRAWTKDIQFPSHPLDVDVLVKIYEMWLCLPNEEKHNEQVTCILKDPRLLLYLKNMIHYCDKSIHEMKHMLAACIIGIRNQFPIQVEDLIFYMERHILVGNNKFYLLQLDSIMNQTMAYLIGSMIRLHKQGFLPWNFQLLYDDIMISIPAFQGGGHHKMPGRRNLEVHYQILLDTHLLVLVNCESQELFLIQQQSKKQQYPYESLLLQPTICVIPINELNEAIKNKTLAECPTWIEGWISYS